MPVIQADFKEFQKLVGKKLPKDKSKLWDITQYVKCEAEIENGIITLELEDTNRPDLWNEAGVARELRGALGIEEGLAGYHVKKSGKILKVHSSVKKIRPFIAAAIAKKVNFDDYQIKQLMQLQDKLDTTFGRNRKKSAIGIYDYDKIIFPVTYKAVNPKSLKFVPLGFSHELTPEEILKEHPKGIEFGKILENFNKYPMLLDAKNNVLSMPPIINSNHLGKVTPETKNVFVEVTGTNYSTVSAAVNIVASYLAEKGADIESVTVKSGRKTAATPDFSTTERIIAVKDVNKRLGLGLTAKEAAKLLLKARYGVKKTTNDNITVEVPFYRTDIMDDYDIIEDIGIAYGYKNIEGEPLKTYTIGELSKETLFSNKVRYLCIGMGFQEVLNYTRCDKDTLFDKDCVEIANPISEMLNALRNELLPVNLLFLSKNTHNEYPQRIFETGPVLQKTKKEVVQEEHLCIIDASADADFTSIKQKTEWLLNNLKIDYSLGEYEHEAYIPGRCAAIIVGGKTAGIFGEISPRTLSRNGLETQAAALEINLERIKK